MPPRRHRRSEQGIGYRVWVRIGRTGRCSGQSEGQGRMKHRAYGSMIVLLVGLSTLLAGCGGEPAANGVPDHPTPQGRIMTANQGANSLSVIDVATNEAYATVPTGNSPHHVVATPDAKEVWVTLYKDNHVQVFDAATMKEIGQVDLGGPSDDLTFA